MKHDVKNLTAEQKLRLICGKDSWHTEDLGGILPQLRLTDASMGVRMQDDRTGVDKPSVSYPSMQMLANTWNRELAEEYAQCVADDCLDYGADVLLGPGINIKRDPLCGRNFEYLSEDPYLAGTLAKAYVYGLQSEGAAACLKHFCCNNAETNRLQQSSDVDERTLREIYYKPFETACEAKPLSVMSSYNRINGVYGSEYKKGYDVLRGEYGFDGLIMSDWDAMRDRTAAAKAGCDLEMPFRADNYEKLLQDYKDGKITEREIDICASRVIDYVYRCKKLSSGKKRKFTLEQRIEFTQKAEEEAIVLLKNNGVLPLVEGTSLAVCGLFARPCAYGRKSPDLICGGGSGRVTRLMPTFDMIELLRKVHGANVEYEPAFSEDGVDSTYMDRGRAVSNAAAQDINIVFAGTGARIECEGGDRATMRLCAAQERTIIDTARVNPNTVVVLFAGAAIDMSAWINDVAAVLYVGFPGENGGNAIANVLTGKVNPSGKTSETFPVSYDDMPAARTYKDSNVTRYGEGLDVGYRYFDTYGVRTLFPFGHGLSYSKFEYNGLKLTVKDSGELEVSLSVTNLSERDGKETVQVYVRACAPRVYRPYKELKGYAKTLVRSGCTELVNIALDKRAFEYWSTAKDSWTTDDGVYEIIVGASSRDIRLTSTIRIEDGKITVLK